MSLKPVWIILAASTDLVELAAKHLTDQFPGYTAGGTIQFHLTGENGTRLILAKGGPPNDYDEEEREQLEAWNLADFVHSVQSKDPYLTLELIVHLSKFTDLVVDDDMGTFLKVSEFLALERDQQISFILSKGI